MALLANVVDSDGGAKAVARLLPEAEGDAT
jgi:hypothetical protein